MDAEIDFTLSFQITLNSMNIIFRMNLFDRIRTLHSAKLIKVGRLF